MFDISPWLWSLPLIAGVIGWFTNFLAVKMLLHPIKPISILGLKIQGVIPRRHQDLAEKISDAITSDFLSHNDLEELIGKVDFQPLMKKIVLQKWDEKIDDILGAIPMIQMFLSADKLDSIRDRLVDAFTDGSGNTASLVAGEISTKIDLKQVIKDNVMAFDLEKLEKIIEKIAAKEFRFVEYLGGVIGFLVGCIQLGIAILGT